MAVKVHPLAVVEPGAELADGVEVGPFCHVGPRVQLGAGCRLISHVCVMNRVVAGRDNVFWPHSVIGADPQDLKFRGEESQLVIGDRNVFRESCTVHIGTANAGWITRVGDDNLFMAASHIAHDCWIGNHVLLANGVLLAGHIRVHDHAVISGGTALHHFVTVGPFAFLGGMTRIVHDCPPFMIVEGNPAKVRGINKIALDRHHFAPEQVDAVKEAYRRLFKNGYQPARTAESLDSLERDFPTLPCIRQIVDFIRNSALGTHGRYLETLRRDDRRRNPPR